MELFGYPGLVLVMVAENVFPPIPSEVVLPLAGFLSHESQGAFQLPLVILAGGLGSVIGALILYGFGAWARDHGGRHVVVAAGRFAFLTEDDVDKATEWFARYGAWAVFTGRFLPLIRSLVSIPAGYGRMPLPQFVVLTAIGTTIWCGFLAGAGWVLGANWGLVRDFLSTYERGVLVLGVAIVAAFMLWRLRQRLGARTV